MSTHEDADRFRQAEEIFQRALDTPPEDWPALLDQACAGDPSLRGEVESLLSAYPRADALLPGSSTKAAGGAPPGPSPRVPGYRILRHLGSGGSGEVYLAEATDHGRSAPVAVKVVRGMVTHGSLLQRFERESLILGGLDHPHIARLFDTGETEDGLPFFAMDYVEGEPIIRWADARNASIPERIELFRLVCSAVHYAHRNLVVHRDLKPGNILVTAEGSPKLLDFGIAKLLDDEAFPVTVEATRTGLRPMTPQYASPEQFSGEPITTATDVYALGILLYLLLTGRFPYDTGGLSPLQIASLMERSAPIRPSLAVGGGGGNFDEAQSEQMAEVARHRKAKPRQLARLLAGDLDNIVLKALQREPERRYSSPEALSADLQRYLEGLPVTARPDTFRYRFGKMVRRNPIATAFATGLLLTITGSAVGFGLLSARLTDERDRSLERQATAEEVSGFLVEVFDTTNPNVQRGQDVSAKELLARASDRIDSALEKGPLVQASLRHSIGVANRRLGLADEAVQHLTAALETRTAAQREDPEQVASTLLELALAYKDQGDSATAERLLRQAIPIVEESSGEDSEEAAKLYDILSQSLINLGRLDEAETWQRRALDIRTHLFGPDDPSVADSLHGLAQVMWEQRDPTAEELERRGLAIREKFLGPDHRDVQASRSNLILVLVEKGAYDEAAELTEKLLEVQRRLLGPDHPNLAFGLTRAAKISEQRGDLEGAEEQLLQAIALRRNASGPGHPHLAALYVNLGSFQGRTGNAKGGEQNLRQGLSIARALTPPRPNILSACLSALADLLHADGRPAEAEPLYREALAVRQSFMPAASPLVARGRLSLAACLVDLGRLRDAEPLIEEVQALVQDRPGKHPPLEAELARQLERLAMESGRETAAMR